MTDLEVLLARVEAAAGPDRGLDCDIFCATAESPFVNYYPDCVLASLGGFAARVEIADIDKFTSSIDAAVALCERVLPGWTAWEIRSRAGKSIFHAEVSRLVNGEEDIEAANSASPALALLAAILRAKITEAKDA